MLISCGVCSVKSGVTGVRELEEIEFFYDRTLITGKCRACETNLAMLIEVRKADDKVFIDSFSGKDADKVVNRERKRLKNKTKLRDNSFIGWVYGVNKESKDKDGTTRIKQYSCDYKTDRKKLEKTIVSK